MHVRRVKRDMFCNELGPCMVVTRDHPADDASLTPTVPAPPMPVDPEPTFDEPEDIE